MKRYLILLLFLISSLALAQSRSDQFKTKNFIVSRDTIKIDTVSINPGFFEIYNQSNSLISKSEYEVDYSQATMWFHKPENYIGKTIEIKYLCYPNFMTKTYSAFDRDLIVSEATDESQLFNSRANSRTKKTNRLMDCIQVVRSQEGLLLVVIRTPWSIQISTCK